MSKVFKTDFYEWPFQNDKASCEDCGKNMDIPDMEDQNRDMKEPFWIEGRNQMKSYCEKCWTKRVSKTLRGEAP